MILSRLEEDGLLPLLLASASPRRAELLRMIGLPFEVFPSSIDETAALGTPEEVVRNLALAKARQVAGFKPGRLVLAADTLVVLGERVFGKPAGPEEAGEMLRALSGREHLVLTGLALVLGKREAVAHEVTRVFFRSLSREEIRAYVASGEPLDKAGAYAAQGLGALLIRRLEGCFFNVVGLPLARLAPLLRDFGLTILGVSGSEPRLPSDHEGTPQ